MLKSAFPKLWLRAVSCTKVLVSPGPSFGFRVRCLSGFGDQDFEIFKSNSPLNIQQASYNRFADAPFESSYQGGHESYKGSNIGSQQSSNLSGSGSAYNSGGGYSSGVGISGGYASGGNSPGYNGGAFNSGGALNSGGYKFGGGYNSGGSYNSGVEKSFGSTAGGYSGGGLRSANGFNSGGAYDSRSGYSRGGGYSGGRYGNQVTGFRGGRGRQGFGGENLHPIQHSNLEPVNKELYREHPAVTNRSQAEIDKFLEENQVNLHGQQNIQRPIFNFEEASFPEPIFRVLSGFSKPTVIQAVSWPLALSGRDIISIAKTGSGKTLGFLLPAIMHVLNQPVRASGDGPIALIVLPTRELAQQVGKVAMDFCSLMGLRTSLATGGASFGHQSRMVREGVDVLVGTPGRLINFLQEGTTNMRRCSFLVADEADRMLDMGFTPQLRKIVSQIRPDRQTLMYSATWPQEVRNLATEFQTDPVLLTVGSAELCANPNITQHVEVVQEHDKMIRLYGLLSEIMARPDQKTLCFVKLKRIADSLTNDMRRNGFPALSLHGDMIQAKRDSAINQFRSGRAKLLVATDVAARGLDVDDIKVVINYDFPKSVEDYVRRIGQAARGETKGESYTFFTSGDGFCNARRLIEVLREAKQEVPQALSEAASGSFPSSQTYQSYLIS